MCNPSLVSKCDINCLRQLKLVRVHNLLMPGSIAMKFCTLMCHDKSSGQHLHALLGKEISFDLFRASKFEG